MKEKIENLWCYNAMKGELSILPKFEVLSEMHKGYLVAVVGGNNKEEAVEISKQAFADGIRSVEVEGAVKSVPSFIFFLMKA